MANKKEPEQIFKMMSIKMPPWLLEALNSVGNKSGYIQRAVIHQLVKDGNKSIVTMAKEAGLL